MPELSRRTLLVGAAIAGAASTLRASAEAGAAPGGLPPAHAADAGVSLRWLENDAPPALVGTTWGVPWPRGTLARGSELSLTTAAGQAVPVQSWPTGFWPDGTVKWTAFWVALDDGATLVAA